VNKGNFQNYKEDAIAHKMAN